MSRLTHRWTAAERDSLPDDGHRYEVLDGELFVTPAPGWTHQRAVGSLYRLVWEFVHRERVGEVYLAPADVVFTPMRAVQPDLFVVPLVDGRSPEHFDEVRRLLLAVEVLSPSSARADRVKKRTIYREEGVDEYWIVDPDARTLERSTPGEPRPEILSEALVWSPASASAPLTIDIVGYFAELLGG
jgi:Uma2 family endonuclease